jgi:hypothetical protein
MKLSEKGSEQHSEGGSGRLEEEEMGRKEPSRPLWGYALDVSQAFRTVSLTTRVRIRAT